MQYFKGMDFVKKSIAISKLQVTINIYFGIKFHLLTGFYSKKQAGGKNSFTAKQLFRRGQISAKMLKIWN